MEHILNIEEQSEELNQIFETIRDGNSILFLGAGASVGSKNYLSQQVIDYYEEYLGKQYNLKDITQFVDVLSADSSFDRNHFDQMVEEMLRKLTPSKGHEVMASIPWIEIITTNYDLLVEKAFDDLRDVNPLELHTVKNMAECNYRVANNEIKYVKLNGCISDKSKYPLVFSTDDFSKSNKYYKNVLNELRNLSPKISFISAGYSFSDVFASQLLEKFDSYNYREKRWIVNIDPYPNEALLEFYKSQRIRIVKCSFEEFFKAYDKWNDKSFEYTVKKKRIFFHNSRGSQIAIPNELAIKLNGVISQLNSDTKERWIKEEDYYLGEEPNYKIIDRNIDVIRSEQISKTKDQILKTTEESSNVILPIFFLTGDFGIGKSTFAYRLIHQMRNEDGLNLVAFEINDFLRLKKQYLVDLFNRCNSDNIILFCDEIERDSVFKALVEIRNDLSMEQFNDFNLFFIAPVRENILAKYKSNRAVRETYEIKLSGKLRSEEVIDLVEKLKSVSLVDYRDKTEKAALVQKIERDFRGDSFVSLLEIVSGGSHVNDLLDAYDQLSKTAKEAFVYTALMHQYKLELPASWLKHIISLDWDEFIEKVVQAEGKGILIQEEVSSFGTAPDLFFRTKHPIIAERLISRIVGNKDKIYKRYLRIFNTVDIGATNSSIVINLLRALIREKVFSNAQIDKLFDVAYTKLSDDPYYLLNYAINLQYRNNKESLKAGIKHLIYAESLFEYRNHRFIHRRAVMNFRLAKLTFDESGPSSNVSYYLDEAKDLFFVKQFLDPCSSYSYTDFIQLLIWEISNYDYDTESELQLRIQIQEQFDLSSRAVAEGIERIDSLRKDYADYLQCSINDLEYKKHLDELYENAEHRPYACILLYSYWEEKEESELCAELLEEMEEYKFNNEIVKFLFKYYGRNLFDANIRNKLFQLSREFSFLEDDIPVRYSFYHFVAESYNRNFNYGLQSLENINKRYNSLNPEFKITWQDPYGEDKVFDAVVIQNSGQRYKAIKVPELQRTFRLVKGNYQEYSPNQDVKVNLQFYLTGMRAKIIK